MKGTNQLKPKSLFIPFKLFTSDNLSGLPTNVHVAIKLDDNEKSYSMGFVTPAVFIAALVLSEKRHLDLELNVDNSQK